MESKSVSVMGHTSMIRALAVSKFSISSAEVRVMYRKNSWQPAFSEMAVSLHLQGTFLEL